MSYYLDRQTADPTTTTAAAAAAPASGSPTNSSGAATPVSTSAASSSFLSSSFYGAFGGIIRRLSSDPAAGNLQPHGAASYTSASDTADGNSGSMFRPENSPDTTGNRHSDSHAFGHANAFPAPRAAVRNFLNHSSGSRDSNNGIDSVYRPPSVLRVASPMLRPPPLEPLALSGFSADTPASARLLTKSVAEEIRIMVPERLRIEDEWKLAYSLDQDGASLATLYEKTARYAEHRSGFVLVIEDREGGIFGAYLTEYPHPSPHYFGTGECFLWRASVLAPLPPPPSADTEHLTARNTTIPAARPSVDLLSGPDDEDKHRTSQPHASGAVPELQVPQPSSAAPQQRPAPSPSPPLPPPSPSIRFSAFPYSGINEYFIYCEAHSLSIGGGDGKYGLWLDDSLERGISATCLTFGNQPLSDEGEKFGVLGLEVWVIGSR